MNKSVNMKYWIILISVFQVHAYWELIFSDEFNGNDGLDQNKWTVENELESCKETLIKPLNCNTNDKRNVRLINGTLAITAIREQHLNKEYTSSVINSKQSFNFGKFEMKAALPVGKMLHPMVALKPTSRSGNWPDDGEIVILTNRQKRILEFGIYFTARGQPKYVGEKFSIATNLRDFHTYVLEWNDRELSFGFDGIKLAIIDFFKELKDSHNPFLKPFTLSVGLGVGGIIFKDQVLTEEDVNDWNCSSLIVDYIRINHWIDDRINGKRNDPIIENYHKSSVDICNAIMADIKLETNQNAFWDRQELSTQYETELTSTFTDISTTTQQSTFNSSEKSDPTSTEFTHSDSTSTPLTILGEIKIDEIVYNHCSVIMSSIQVLWIIFSFSVFL